MCFLFNRTALQVLVTYLTGALYAHPLWFYKHQHDNRVRSKLFVACQRWCFQWQFWFVPLVPRYLWEEEEHKPDPWRNTIERNHIGLHLENEVAVVKTPTIISNNPAYTGCPRRNVPDFGRVFLVLKYTDITQNAYIQSWTVTEIMAREKCGLLAVPRTTPFQLTRYVYSAHVVETGMQSTVCLRAHVNCLEPQGRLRR